MQLANLGYASLSALALLLPGVGPAAAAVSVPTLSAETAVPSLSLVAPPE